MLKVALKTFSFLVMMGLASSFAQAQPISSQADRKTQPGRFEPLPNFKTLEFVRDGIENDPLMRSYLRADSVEWVHSQGLTWLEVRDVYIDKQNIVRNQNAVLVPIVASVRYQKLQFVIDGTVNALFHITTTPQGQLTVELLQYEDSKPLEAVGRNLWGIEFDRFIQDIAGETLLSYFKKPGSLDNVPSLHLK